MDNLLMQQKGGWLHYGTVLGQNQAVGDAELTGFDASRHCETHRRDYMENANREILVGIQIETKTAIENLDAILDVPGLDLIFIGPNDLHLSLGLVPRYWSDEPAYRQAVERVAAGCRVRNLPLGTLCLNADAVQARRADGNTFLGMGSDAGYLLGAVGAEYGKIFDQEPPPEGWAGRVRPTK